jgi:TatD DNase family protein
MSLIDSHCHLDDKQFHRDREAVIQRARVAGIELMLAIGSGPPDLEAGLRLAEAWPEIYATVGVHPHDAARADESTWARLAELLRRPKVLAVGEIGLDYHYDFSPRPAQREAFIQQLRLAREAGKPVVIHTREAWPATLALLREHWQPAGLPGIMHCFSEGPPEALQVVEMGFYVSFAGVVTYPKALRVQQAARRTPLERVLVETDAPYLPPEPYRGKRNEPAWVEATARRLAELRGESFEQLAAATTANFRRLFGLPGPSDLPVPGGSG